MEFFTAIFVMMTSAMLYEHFQKRWMEVAVGCVVVALISLMVAIVVAPWQIQGLLLLGILLSPSLIKRDVLF